MSRIFVSHSRRDNLEAVNGGRKLTPFRRLKIDPLVFILRLTIPGLARGRGL